MSDLLVTLATAGIVVAVILNSDSTWRLFMSYWREERKHKLPDYPKLTGVPPPKPIYDFDIENTRPRPYRPFRWEYHQTMSLMKFEPDWWIELDSTYVERIDQRKKLYAKHGKLVMNELAGSQEASKEYMEMVIQYVCRRYPNQFQYDDRTGMFSNNILRIKVDTTTIDPLVFLLEHIPEDFLIVEKDSDTGFYVLRAGVATSAIGWNISQKMGQPLHEIHGPVPDYKEKLSFSMDRYFSNMACDKPIQRGAWGIEVGKPLFLQVDDPGWSVRETQNPDLQLSNIYLRVDWQGLRRLPKSRAVVISFRALFTPITDLRREPYIPKLVLKVLLEGKQSIMEYKGTWYTEHKVIPALREWAKEQEEGGLVPKDWEAKTLDENPFFPGWKEQYPVQA